MLSEAEIVFATLGPKPSDYMNMFLAQVALRSDIPFRVSTQPERLMDAPAQAKAWNDALGEY